MTESPPDDDEETGEPTPIATSLATAGRVLWKAGVWAGRSAHAAYTAVDPSFRQHLAESSVLGLTMVAGRRTPDLRLPDDGGRAVVFIHGLAGHRGNFVPLQRYFAYRGRTRVISIGFEDYSSIESIAEQLKTVLRELLAVNELPAGPAVDLIAHSMGGIVCRLALLDEDIASRVDRLITIATPHDGTQLARFLDTAKLRSLRPGSELLQRLEAQLPWRARAGHPRLVCFWSRQDLVLLPPESAYVDGAVAVELNDCTHNGFLIRPRAIREIFAAASDG
jgi:pimeloyl-ACP methyl ester carboxylesterase